MSSSPDYPEPTQQERDLQQAQVDALRQQQAMLDQLMKQQQLLAPLVYQQMGIIPQYDDQGNITGYTLDPNSPQAQQQTAFQQQLQTQELLQPFFLKQLGLQGQYDDSGNLIGITELPQTEADQTRQQLEVEQNQRALAALRGELPIDEGLLQSLDTREQQLRQELQASLGPDYATSTPGMEALARFGQAKEVALDQARRGDITMASQLGLQTGAANQAALQQQLSNLYGLSGPVLNTAGAYGGSQATLGSLYGTATAPYQGAGQYGQLSSLYGAAAAPYAGERARQYQAAYQQFLMSPLNRYVYTPTETFFNSFASSFGNSLGGFA